MSEQKKPVVCIDDDPFYTDLYTNIFESRGYEVHTANDPASGLELIRKHRPALVTLDVMMPEQESVLDGYGMLQQLQEDPQTKDLPVIMISALGDQEDVQHGLELGARAYLPKHEMSPTGLIDLVKRVTGEQ
jgi:CheY-like chemotaxis protein